MIPAEFLLETDIYNLYGNAKVTDKPKQSWQIKALAGHLPHDFRTHHSAAIIAAVGLVSTGKQINWTEQKVQK